MQIVTCKVDACDNSVAVKKWQLCKQHYNRWMVFGDYNVTARLDFCKGCGVKSPREKAAKGPYPEYCSKECRYEHSRADQLASGRYEQLKSARAPVPRKSPVAQVCDWCGVGFQAVRANRWCSKSCTNKFYRHGNTARACILDDCSRPVVAKEMCDPHYKRWMRAIGRIKNSPWDERRKAHWSKRDALKRGASGAEVFTHLEVFERDKWVCRICEEEIDQKLKYPNPLSASLDHIVPLSKDGLHVLENVQAAHLVCNVRKGNRLEEARG